MHLLSSGKNFTKCPTHVPPHVLNKWKLHFSLNMQVFLQKSFIGWRMENKVMLMIWLSCVFRFSEIRVENVQWDPTCLLDSFQHISIFRNYLTIFVVTSSCYILHNFHPKSLLGLAIMQLPEVLTYTDGARDLLSENKWNYQFRLHFPIVPSQ